MVVSSLLKEIALSLTQSDSLSKHVFSNAIATILKQQQVQKLEGRLM